MDDLLTVGDAARVLDLTSRSVQDLENRGRLPAIRTARGLRLFKRSDVDQLAEERAAKRRRRESARAERDGHKDRLAASTEVVPS